MAAFAILPALGCQRDMGNTAVFVQVHLAAGVTAPDALLLSWFDSEKVLLRDRRTSVDGAAALADPVATLAIEVSDPGPDPRRRVLVRALVGANMVGEGAGRVDVVVGQWVAAPIDLEAMPLADADGDGFPDAIDNCPGADDLAGCAASDPAP